MIKACRFSPDHKHKTPSGETIAEQEMARIALCLIRMQMKNQRLDPNKIREILAKIDKKSDLDTKKVKIMYEVLTREAVDEMFPKPKP